MIILLKVQRYIVNRCNFFSEKGRPFRISFFPSQSFREHKMSWRDFFF